MTHNRFLNHCLICAFILITGLGLALALPWLLNSQSLAAHHINAPTSPGPCYATYDNGMTVIDSADASAVQAAVDAAVPGDVVKLAGTCEGVELSAGLNQTVYISKSLTLEGGHTETNWTLDPDPDIYTTTLNADNSGRVIVISGTINVTLDSIFLTGGLADDGTLDNHGGGIWSNRALTLTNSIVFSNTANNCGGGMYNLGVSPMLTNVTFFGNSAFRGGAMYNNGNQGNSSPAMTNVTFSGNSANDGGAMYNYGLGGTSSPSLNNVTFSGNSVDFDGGAMYNYGLGGTSSPSLRNVTFSGNSADTDDGGAMFNNGRSIGNSNPTLSNVTFSGNSAGDRGGAMYNDGSGGTSSPNLRNVTFSGNSARWYGGAMYNSGTSSGTCEPDARNSILWNNQAAGVTGTISANIYNNEATTTLTFGLAQGTGFSGGVWIGGSYVDGGGNIDEDPLFILDIDPSTAPTTTGNLRLQTGSPAIDAGDNAYATGVVTDLDGEPRIKDGNGDGTATVDMGAYEFGDETYIPLIFR